MLLLDGSISTDQEVICNHIVLFYERLFTEQLAQLGVPSIFGGVVLGKNMILDSMCKRSGESVGHLLLHCQIESALWSNFFSQVGMA